jgi:uncharacterized protein
MTMRAFSLLAVKDVNDERREVSGVASTPTVDRVGDIVEPTGAKFQTPMPLLMYHDNQKPVGSVDFAKPTKRGIPFKASIPEVVEPGVIQDRVNEAWHSLKYRLIGAVSIGFRAMKDGVELLDDGGLRFKEWEWLELSLVSVPANPEALIHSFKSMDMIRAFDLDLGNDDERDALAKSLKKEQRIVTINKPKILKAVPADQRRPGVVYLR